MTDSSAVVSVVTVVYNDAEGLAETLASTRLQKDVVIEQVVVDGGSTDGTQSVIDRHQGMIDAWTSEPDEGIYDAMNKGARLATADWVIFMNAGDCFVADDAVAGAMAFAGDADLVYGNSYYRIGDIRQFVPVRSLDRVWQGMPFSHQAMFVRRKLLEEHPFDTRLAIAADYEFVLAMYVSGKRFVDSGMDIAVMDASGISRTDRASVWKEQALIAGRYFPGEPVQAYYGRKILMDRLKSPLRFLLPERWVAMIKNLAG